MAAGRKGPLDDEPWQRPDINQWWIQSEGGSYMDENLIHRYFSESPFFDWTSKNGLILDQSKRDFNLWEMSKNRKQFEDFLRSKEGLEFVIVETPKPVADKELAAQGVTTGIYVIRKQERTQAPTETYVRPPHVLLEKGSDGKSYDVTILGTYYIVGENVMQAPSVFDVVSNRLLTSATILNDFYDIVESLPRFTPAAGFHYLPRARKPTSSLSVPGTPSRSREGSVAPGTEEQSLRSGSVQPDSHAGGASTSNNVKEMRLLELSLSDAIQFADDYIDENPLTGEPGNFRFSATTAAIKKRRADEEAAEAKAKVEKESANASRVATPKPEKAPTPPAVFSDAKATGKEKTGKEGGKKKGDRQRKKSRANVGGTATSPTTPGSATSTQAPNSAL